MKDKSRGYSGSVGQIDRNFYHAFIPAGRLWKIRENGVNGGGQNTFSDRTFVLHYPPVKRK